MRGAVVRGILPEEEAQVTDLAAQLRDGTLAACSRALERRARRRSWRATWAWRWATR
jgi:hypothetical protein